MSNHWRMGDKYNLNGGGGLIKVAMCEKHRLPVRRGTTQCSKCRKSKKK